MSSKLFLVIAEGGTLLYSYPRVTENEKVLLSALVHAIGAIEQEVLRSEGNRYKFESEAGALYVKKEGGLYFALLSDKPDDKKIWKQLDEAATEFIKQFPEASEGLIDLSQLEAFDETAEKIFAKPRRFEVRKLIDRVLEEGKGKGVAEAARIFFFRRASLARARFGWASEREKVSSAFVEAVVLAEGDLKSLGRKMYARLKELISFIPKDIDFCWIPMEAIYARLFGKGFDEAGVENLGDSIRVRIKIKDSPLCKAREGGLELLAGVFEALVEDLWPGCSAEGREEVCVEGAHVIIIDVRKR